MSSFLEVVKATKKGPHRFLLSTDECSINKKGYYVLPKGFFFKCRFEKIFNKKWESLPELGKVETLRKISIDCVLYSITNNLIPLNVIFSIPRPLRNTLSNMICFYSNITEQN